MEINHDRLEMQNYLKSEDIDNNNDKRKYFFAIENNGAF